MNKVYKAFCKVEEFICGTGFFTIIVLVFISAIARGLRHPLAWSIDLSLLLLAWVSFLGADCAFRSGQLVGIDIVTRCFPLRMRKAIDLLVLLLILTALVIFVVFGIKLSFTMVRRSFQALPISYSVVTLSLPVAAFSMVISTVLKIKDRLVKFTTNEPIGQSEEQAGLT